MPCAVKRSAMDSAMAIPPSKQRYGAALWGALWLSALFYRTLYLTPLWHSLTPKRSVGVAGANRGAIAVSIELPPRITPLRNRFYRF